MNENRMCDLAEMKERLISCVKSELEKGVENVNAIELGEVVDMIKDLAQCEKYCWEAEYYQTVVEAMEDDEEPEYESRMGYTRTGRTSRMRKKGDVRFSRPYRDQEPYIDAYFDDPEFRSNMRMGYDHHKTDAEKITDTMTTIRDIWKHADPELKQRMKTDFSNLLGEMT